MEAVLVNAKITIVLLGWILAVYGFGYGILNVYDKLIKGFKHTEILAFALIPIIGIAFLSFLTQIINLFTPITSIISLLLLIIGILLFIWLSKITFNWQITLSILLAFTIVMILSFISDSYGDSVNYHIQIATWIQQSPVIFGLANIHGRLGFNGIIYNFYALTDVSQIFSNTRSFIGNEITYFGLFVSVFYVIFTKSIDKKYTLFLLCASIAFPFLLYWGEFRGLYCEGIGAVLGIIVFCLLFIALDSSEKYKIFILAFFIALFASLVKIANTGLLLAVIMCFILAYRTQVLQKSFIKNYLYLGIFSLIYAIPWVIKGIMTSGMIAYPASVGYIESLSWAVSNEQRTNEVCWIMSWARNPGKNCQEVLASYAWLKDFIFMKTRYFGWYFKYFIYSYGLGLALGIGLFLLKRDYKEVKNFLIIIGLILVGVCFWFLSGPDPRFGMAYLIPLIGIVCAYNLHTIYSFKNTKYKKLFYGLFLLSIAPLLMLKLRFLSLGLALGALHPKSKILQITIVALVCLDIFNLMRRDYVSIKNYQKIKPIFVQERITDFGTKVFVRRDELENGFISVDYEPLPTTPYWNPKIKQEKIMGRKAYINTQKDQTKK